MTIALGVLSWLAFGIAAYLAWHAIGSSSVAGCVVGSHNGCDAVLNSAWSKWLGIPVAVLGLACYASLAGLSVMLWFHSGVSRWITTAFMLFATLAAGASLWFIAVQVFAIGDFCPYCLATDFCGIALGAIAGWCAYRWWSRKPQLRNSGSSATTLSALRSAIPASTRLAPVAARAAAPAGSSASTPAGPRTPPTASVRSVPLVGAVSAPSSRITFAQPPSMPIAYGGALALLVILIGGQVVFPAKTFDVQQPDLTGTLDLSGENVAGNSLEPPEAETHIAMRIPTEGETQPTDQTTVSSIDATGNGNGPSTGDKDSGQTEAPSSQSPPQAKPERKIKLLGGRLTLDVADEPIIGSVNAPHVVVEMVSYDCSHCRKTNKLMKKALSRYGDQVVLVVLALPLEAKCNRLITDAAASHSGACATARTAIALAKVKPISFPRFHEFLMSGDEKKAPSLASVISKAFGMADRGKLQAMRDSKDVEKKVASYVDLYALLRDQNSKNKKFGLPIQILGDHVMFGGVEKAEDIYKAWEEHLGVKSR